MSKSSWCEYQVLILFFILAKYVTPKVISDRPAETITYVIPYLVFIKSLRLTGSTHITIIIIIICRVQNIIWRDQLHDLHTRQSQSKPP